MDNNFNNNGEGTFIPKTPEPQVAPPPPPPQYYANQGVQQTPPPQYYSNQGVQQTPPPQYYANQGVRQAPPPQYYANNPYGQPQQYAQAPQYRYNQQVPPQYAPPPQYYRQPQYVPSPAVAVQENGIPLIPRPEERKFIKRFYNCTGGILLGVFGAMMLFLFIAMGIIESVTDGMGIPELTVNTYISIAMVIIYVCCEFGGSLLGSKLTNMRLKPLFTTKTFSVGFLLFGIAFILAWQAVEFFVLIITESGLNIFDLTMLGTDEEPVTAFETAVMTIYSVILAPIFEEILFRGFVLKNLSRFNVRFGIIMSAILFGLFHGNLSQFIGATCFGVIVALTTVKANSLIPAIVMHSVGNGMLSLMSLIYQSNETVGDTIYFIWMFAGAVIFIFMAIIALIKGIYKLPKKTELQRNRGAKIAMTSIPILILIGIEIIEILLNIETL
ncbi:MAG: CPBP family intramembrane metalloprotease [Ruminococcus sp.]|nr:CPBP family intramembrane metalloprotease [Ruminococcus sp.]